MKKCSSCKCDKAYELFINHKNKEFKTCEECRNKRKKKTTDETTIPDDEPKTTDDEPKTTDKNEIYYFILHQRKWKQFNREFENRVIFPRHKYEMRPVFNDIINKYNY